jgi:L-fuculose-phosphate aldolase
MKDRQYFLERVSREMDEDVEIPARDAPQQLALAARILAAKGHESGLAGQVTARAEQPGT